MQPWRGGWGLPEPLSGGQWAPPGYCLSRSPPGVWGWGLPRCWAACRSHQRWSKIPSLDTQQWDTRQEVKMTLTSTFILKSSYLKNVWGPSAQYTINAYQDHHYSPLLRHQNNGMERKTKRNSKRWRGVRTSSKWDLKVGWSEVDLCVLISKDL